MLFKVIFIFVSTEITNQDNKRIKYSLKMPLFGNKFSPKKTPARKSIVSLNSEETLDELFPENKTITLTLGDQRCTFQNGEWVPENGYSGSTHKAVQKLQNKIHHLQEENNLLKVKFEILLNMLSQTTAESHIQQREIDKLKKLEQKR